MRPDLPDFPIDVTCACGQPDARYDCFDQKPVGVDETEGRFADVSLLRCRTCDRLWLRYFCEHEASPRSGRWARGLISEAEAEAITPETAEPYLAGLPWFLAGGSYFGGTEGRRSGGLHWGP